VCGGGRGEVCSSVQWLYELSAECQPATAREKGEGAGIGIFADCYGQMQNLTFT
jgi:hypothetical protein